MTQANDAMAAAVAEPHQAGATFEARHRQGNAVVDEIKRFRQGLPPRREVRPESLDALA